MKEITIQVYEFSELSDAAKKKAIEKHWDILTFHRWWEFIYEDANRLGLKISSFDLYPKTIDITYQDDPDDVANAILEEFGEGTDLHRYATEYLSRYKQIEQLVEDDEVLPSDELNELNDYFLRKLGNCFLDSLQSDFDWRTSNEAIGEELELLHYDFFADGRRFNY